MTKTLVIAEKPSVAQDIVRALTPVAGKFEKHEDHFENDRYVVTSAVGHLVEIKAPEEYDVKRGKWSFAHLPVIPPFFDLKPVDKTKTRLNAVVKQARRKDVTALVNACDAGREGELIFRLIEQYAGAEKAGKHVPLGKPVKRLWLQSMTPQAIRDGFDALRADPARTCAGGVGQIDRQLPQRIQRHAQQLTRLQGMAAELPPAQQDGQAEGRSPGASQRRGHQHRGR